ncbi:methyltransferase domain-containing protein [Ramlibacter sp. USB13]|uniref:Methyltransferase domain-containing protein n=1 Tax=Ramlibacter cellulosilyticus TaxID=2764187 RepID=A0A923MLF5_9BURK|nr:class I SAM-dependent methyltransferase [Ramlibacter cellulosilyticus]MBC5781313.1 methyltransferase domain-containing protein [Ramlibacter cellulosilyticus]
MTASIANAVAGPQAAATPDFAAIKTRQKAAWASGDYAVVGTTLQIVGETLCEAADLRAGERVLDVAAGNGNATLAAARRWCEVTSTDYVPALLERARERAAAERLHAVDFQEADAEALPFDDGSFDVVLSTFGCMFAPNPPRVASELLRVCRSGGRIAMANWTPEGFIGQLFKTVGRYVPPPAGVASPAQWGSRDRINELFEASARSVATEKRHFAFRYRSPDHMLEVFRGYYGPVLKAFGALDADGQQALAADLTGLMKQFDAGQGGGLVIPSAYLEIVITRR